MREYNGRVQGEDEVEGGEERMTKEMKMRRYQRERVKVVQ